MGLVKIFETVDEADKALEPRIVKNCYAGLELLNEAIARETIYKRTKDFLEGEGPKKRDLTEEEKDIVYAGCGKDKEFECLIKLYNAGSYILFQERVIKNEFEFFSAGYLNIEFLVKEILERLNFNQFRHRGARIKSFFYTVKEHTPMTEEFKNTIRTSQLYLFADQSYQKDIEEGMSQYMEKPLLEDQIQQFEQEFYKVMN